MVEQQDKEDVTVLEAMPAWAAEVEITAKWPDISPNSSGSWLVNDYLGESLHVV